MKYLIPVIFAFSLGVARAEKAQEHCETAATASGVDTAACDCIIDALDNDETLIEEYLTINTVEDYEASSDALQGALSACSDWE